MIFKKNCQNADYPYNGEYGECQFDEETCTDKIVNSYMFIGNTHNSKSFKNGIFLKPSNAVLVANCKTFRFYKEGIISYQDCPPDDYPNFSVLAVGYGYDEEADKDWFKILVPWGEDFGQKGHIYLEDIDTDGDR